ncbi:hypothetical protein AKUH3B103M_PHAGE100500 (plasmid) [Apilactobacillus kunkeei]|nr:hypothetical protein AKUH3B103M_PHAGE100500 [Apilactobacillus kunkeei]
MKFTVGKIIMYTKQIERIHNEDMRINANAIGLAFSKDNSKGGEQ